MSQDIKELRVNAEENTKRTMYLAKEFLLNNEFIDVVASTVAAMNATRTVETLVRLNYVTIEDVKTETSVVADKRRIRLVIRVRKTGQFQKLYDENEANRKKKEAEREANPQTQVKKN